MSGPRNLRNESSKPKILLDTKPLIKFFAKEEGWEPIQKILSMIEDEKIEASISVVTLTEIQYEYMQERRADLAKTRTEQLRYTAYIKKLEINEETAIKAGEFKGKYHIPIADAFIAASAYYTKSIVISDDADFKKISEIETRTEEEFNTHIST
ncbi:MAG: PIN domain-containing protein [Candidatus Bathyarchaeota archaeon]|nr:PIN domain-containing protein [Candidatus Bathyarchaeota archaeon]